MSRSPSRPGRFRVSGFPLIQVLAMAYGIVPARIVVSDWARRARFDIEATMPVSTTPSQRAEMLRGLLEDRFSVIAKRELRSMSVFALERLRDDRLGPQLKQVQRDCAKSAADAASRCNWTEGMGQRIASGITWDNIPLAAQIESYLGVPVIDRTKLSGQFDLRLEWQEGLLADGSDQSQRPGSLEGALREQLGLKLEKVRADVEVLVIESISMPSPN
jgi:uncharacterized protein (TIGR03435 family)